ncbi:MAG: hypothetical protein ABJA11_03200 [Pseudolysinimonas sp.]
MRMQVSTVAVLAAGLAAVLLGCSATPTTPPRTEPNAVERSAVAVSRAVSSPQTSTSTEVWTQLWTTNQAGGVIERCVARESGGFLAVRIGPLQGAGALEIEYGIIGNFSIRDDPFTTPAGAAQLVDACVASAPIDTRRLLVPRQDWATLYSYDVTVLRRCLIEHGQAVPTVPDRATYEGRLRAGEPVSPYDKVRMRDRAAWYALSDACPALPTAIAKHVAALSDSSTTP